MPPRAREASLFGLAECPTQEQRKSKRTTVVLPKLDGVVIRGASSGRSSTRTNTQVPNQEAQSRLLSKTSCSFSRSGSGSPDVTQTSRRFSPEPRCPKPLSLFQSRANEPHRKLPAVKRHRRRVCAGLCKQITADWTNISTNSDTEA